MAASKRTTQIPTLVGSCGAAALFLQFWSQVPGFTFVDHAFAFKPGAWILTTGMLLVVLAGLWAVSATVLSEAGGVRYQAGLALDIGTYVPLFGLVLAPLSLVHYLTWDDLERRLTLFLERGELPEIPQADFAGKKMVEMLDEGARRAIIEPVRTIAIDPGHGGTNTGRVSRAGVMEKNVNLAIALMLRDRLMQELGVDVVMTRSEDIDVSFEDRVETANTSGSVTTARPCQPINFGGMNRSGVKDCRSAHVLGFYHQQGGQDEKTAQAVYQVDVLHYLPPIIPSRLWQRSPKLVLVQPV